MRQFKRVGFIDCLCKQRMYYLLSGKGHNLNLIVTQSNNLCTMNRRPFLIKGSHFILTSFFVWVDESEIIKAH